MTPTKEVIHLDYPRPSGPPNPWSAAPRPCQPAQFRKPKRGTPHRPTRVRLEDVEG